MLDSIAGRDSFEFYCASCHARGKGDGPIASALKSRHGPDVAGPTEPRCVSKRSRTCRGNQYRPTSAGHGSPDMPAWGLSSAGSIRWSSREAADRQYRYLRWDTAGAGRWSGRFGCTALQNALCDVPRTERAGDGPLADQLRRLTPDLTKFSARNGGVFPSERCTGSSTAATSLSRRSPDMPVEGDVFRDSRGAGGTSDSAKASRRDRQIPAGIQQRPA